MMMILVSSWYSTGPVLTFTPWLFEKPLFGECEPPNCLKITQGGCLYNDITGWWYTYPSEKYEFVSWDDDIPN